MTRGRRRRPDQSSSASGAVQEATRSNVSFAISGNGCQKPASRLARPSLLLACFDALNSHHPPSRPLIHSQELLPMWSKLQASIPAMPAMPAVAMPAIPQSNIASSFRSTVQASRSVLRLTLRISTATL